jgi:hypothetical protein
VWAGAGSGKNTNCGKNAISIKSVNQKHTGNRQQHENPTENKG